MYSDQLLISSLPLPPFIPVDQAGLELSLGQAPKRWDYMLAIPTIAGLWGDTDGTQDLVHTRKHSASATTSSAPPSPQQ